MIDIQVATSTVTGRLVCPDGDGPGLDTFIEFSVTMGDNCCDGHAQEAARSMVSEYAMAHGWVTQFDQD